MVRLSVWWLITGVFSSMLLLQIGGCAKRDLPVTQTNHQMSSERAPDSRMPEAVAMQGSAASAQASEPVGADILSEAEFKSGILFASGGGAQPLVLQYLVPDANKTRTLATIDVSSWGQRAAQRVDQLVYYLDPYNNLQSFNLLTGKTVIITDYADLIGQGCSVIDNGGASGVLDFMVMGERIYAIVGPCQRSNVDFEGALRLNVVNLKQQAVTASIDLTDVLIGRSGIAFDRELTTSEFVRLFSIFGDAGHAAAILSRFDPVTGEVSIVDRLSYSPCEDESEVRSGICTQVDLDENRRYEKILPWQMHSVCGPWSIEKERYGGLRLTRGETVIDVNDGFVVDCLS